jgi:hypothetical protein
MTVEMTKFIDQNPWKTDAYSATREILLKTEGTAPLASVNNISNFSFYVTEFAIVKMVT